MTCNQLTAIDQACVGVRPAYGCHNGNVVAVLAEPRGKVIAERQLKKDFDYG